MITAEEAREISETVRQINMKKEEEKIFTQIKEAVGKGYLDLIVDYIPEETQKTLEHLGYKLIYKSFYWSITWIK